MNYTKIGASIATAALLTIGASANAAVTHGTTNGINFNTTGISSFTTDGDDMDGMSITAFFRNGGSQTVSYLSANCGNDCGQANGTNWSLRFSGDTTFSDDWELDTTSSIASEIVSLVINGAPGSTVFDVYDDDVFQTPGSADGGPGNPSGPTGVTGSGSAYSGNVNFQYSNRVALNNTYHGDLFTTLTITFSTWLNKNKEFNFVTDTDNSAVRGDIVQVPEPGMIGLLGLGLVGLGFARRRKAA